MEFQGCFISLTEEKNVMTFLVFMTKPVQYGYRVYEQKQLFFVRLTSKSILCSLSAIETPKLDCGKKLQLRLCPTSVEIILITQHLDTLSD